MCWVEDEQLYFSAVDYTNVQVKLNVYSSSSVWQQLNNVQAMSIITRITYV